MLYIHKLGDLSVKSAEIESVTILRDLKRSASHPISIAKLKDRFAAYFVSQQDIDLIAKAAELTPSAVEAVSDMITVPIEEYDVNNLCRAHSALKEIVEPLKENFAFSSSILEQQESFMPVLALAINSLPVVRTENDKKECNDNLNFVFSSVLRTDKFGFNSSGIVGEPELARITKLAESMAEGTFFHVKLEEHLKKSSFEDIKNRISPDELKKFEDFNEMILQIKEGTEKAYECNMRMVHWAIVLYSYIKWSKEAKKHD
jgi:hypothetical protein